MPLARRMQRAPSMPANLAAGHGYVPVGLQKADTWNPVLSGILISFSVQTVHAELWAQQGRCHQAKGEFPAAPQPWRVLGWCTAQGPAGDCCAGRQEVTVLHCPLLCFVGSCWSVVRWVGGSGGGQEAPREQGPHMASCLSP